MNGKCLDCIFFRNDPGYMEEVFPGLNTLSSAYGSVRADTGVCSRHDLLVASWKGCADFQFTGAGSRLLE